MATSSPVSTGSELLQGSRRVLFLLDAIERHLRTHCEAAGPQARGGAVACIHRFGSAFNAHTHFHVCAIDGVFEPNGEGVHLHPAPAPSPEEMETVQVAVRRRTLHAFQRRGWLERGDRLEMEQWPHGGGFSLDASVRIAGGDRRGRLQWIGAERVRHRLPRPRPYGRSELILSPPELIERVAALVPAQTATLGPARPHEALPTAAGEAAPEQTDRSRKARYLWVVLLARIYEAFPLTCPHCAGEMRIVAFVTGPVAIQEILAHIGEPTRPPMAAKSWIPRPSPPASIR